MPRHLGYGMPRHRDEAVAASNLVRVSGGVFRDELERGQCNQALSSLLDTVERIGEVKAQLRSSHTFERINTIRTELAHWQRERDVLVRTFNGRCTCHVGRRL